MLIRHSAIYVIAKLLPGLLGLATTSILTRVLDPERYGLYGLALVVMSFGATMSFEWLNISFMRFYQARREHEKVISTVIQLFCIIVVMTAIVFGVITCTGIIPASEWLIYLIGLLLMWAYAWFELVTKFEIADFRPIAYFWMNLRRAIFMLAGTAGAAISTHDPVWTAAGTAFGIICGCFPIRIGRPQLRRNAFDRTLAREIVIFGIPLAASLVMGSVVTSGTRAIIEWLGSNEALGFYTAAFILVQNTLVMLASGIAAASYSLAVRAVETEDPIAARRQLLDNATLLLFVMAPASLGMALTAPGIALTLVGPRYVTIVSHLTPWLAVGSFFGTFRAHYLDHAFQLGRKSYLQIRVIGLSAIISVGLCLWLIPWIGAEGAAISFAAAMTISCFHARAEGRAAYPLPLPIMDGVKIAAGCCVMALIVRCFSGDTITGFGLQVATGSFAYLTVVASLNVFGARDYVLQALGRQRYSLSREKSR